MGWALAFSIYGNEGGQVVPVLDTNDFKDHLQLIVTYRTWGLTFKEGQQFGSYEPKQEVLTTHTCTAEDYEREGFAPANPAQEKLIE